MTISNPRSELNIESEISILLDNENTPQSGTIKFKDDAPDRSMNALEASAYWDYASGMNALRDYLRSQGRLPVHTGFTAIPPGTAEEFEGWKFLTNNPAAVARMIFVDPPTPLRVESEITIEVNNNGTPVGGMVKFKEDVPDHAMSPVEATTYWARCHGSRSLWALLQSQDKVTLVQAGGVIPSDWYESVARAITLNGGEIIGKLLPGNQTENTIQAEDACCGPISFTTNSISQLQKMKSTAGLQF